MGGPTCVPGLQTVAGMARGSFVSIRQVWIIRLYGVRVAHKAPEQMGPKGSALMLKHKHAIGDTVRVIPDADARSRMKSIADSQFKIVRLLPMGPSSLQYRVRDMFSGQERIVGEYDVTAWE
jgi:hypothetical protein